MSGDFIQEVSESWEPLWQPPARSQEVIEARLQLHWAVQLLAAVAKAEAELAPDDSHGSLSWDAKGQRFVGQPTRSGQRVSLAPATLRLTVSGEDGAFDLAGRTLSDALAWLRGKVAAAAGGEPQLGIGGEGIPSHAVAKGAAFAAPGAGHAELARWYAVSARLLDLLRGRHRDAGPVRCWPHHFDVATLLPFGNAPGGEARSIGVGMTPGDGWHPEPYFYVLPWPPPNRRPQRLGSGGFWNTEGWTGAALVAHRIADRPALQGAQVAAFVQQAVAACKELLGV